MQDRASTEGCPDYIHAEVATDYVRVFLCVCGCVCFMCLCVCRQGGIDLILVLTHTVHTTTHKKTQNAGFTSAVAALKHLSRQGIHY